MTRRSGKEPDRFDILRKPAQIFTFGFGPHFCLGANLAKVEGRVALETILPRIPEWTVDYDNASLTKGIDTRVGRAFRSRSVDTAVLGCGGLVSPNASLL